MDFVMEEERKEEVVGPPCFVLGHPCHVGDLSGVRLLRWSLGETGIWIFPPPLRLRQAVKHTRGVARDCVSNVACNKDMISAHFFSKVLDLRD